ncbi:hypothetical protein WJX79_003585 [Trebouxia sp. C0005]
MIFVESAAATMLPLHRPTRCATRQGLKCVSLRSPAPLAHVHGQHGNKIHMDRSAKLRNFTCSAAPDISKEAPARGRDFDYGMFATSEPAQTSDASPQDTSWIRPVWDALKPASAAAIGVVARAIGGKGVLLALSCAVEHYTMAVGLAGIYVALLTGSDVGYPYLQGRIAVSAAAWDFAKCNTLLINLLDGLLAWGPRVLLLLALATWMKGISPSFAATYSSACDAFKTSMKALVLLFLGVAAQALNREVRAKGVCLAAMTLLKFAVAAVICSMYMLTMHFVTSAAYWNECLWREVRISNSVFQGVVRVLESSAEVLSRETARGGIESVGILCQSTREAQLPGYGAAADLGFQASSSHLPCHTLQGCAASRHHEESNQSYSEQAANGFLAPGQILHLEGKSTKGRLQQTTAEAQIRCRHAGGGSWLPINTSSH